MADASGPPDVDLPPPPDLPPLARPDAARRARMASLVASTARRPPTWREALSERSTSARLLLGAGFAVLAGLVFVGPIRPDLVLLRDVAMPLVFAVSWAAASLLVALRPMHVGGGSTWERFAPAWALALPVMIVFPWPGIPLTGSVAAGGALVCGAMGAATAVLAAAGVLLLDRSPTPSAFRVWAAAGVGGAVGLVFREVHCMANDTFHLLAAHLSLGIVAAAVLFVALRFREA